MPIEATQTQPPASGAATATEVKPAAPATITQPPTAAAELDLQARQRAIRDNGARIKGEKDALALERKQLAADKAELEAHKRRQALALTNPAEFLRPIYGQDWQGVLAKTAAGDTDSIAILQLRQEIADKEKARIAEESQRTEAQKTAEAEAKRASEEEDNRAKQQFREETTKQITDSAAYPSIAALGAAPQVAERIIAEHAKTGKIRSVDEVAKEIEAEADTLFAKLLELPKWKEKLGAMGISKTTVVPPPQPQSIQPQWQPARKTLSTDMNAGGVKPPNGTPRLTREQRIAGLMAKDLTPGSAKA